MSDLIKREDAIKAIAEVLSLNRFSSFKDIKNFDRFAERMLRSIPSADRPQGWIPCEERLPEEEGHYLVTFGAFTETINGEKIIFGDIDRSVSEIGYGCYEKDIFWHPTAFGWYDLDTAAPFDKRAIIAWMPLPKPWKGADDE